MTDKDIVLNYKDKANQFKKPDVLISKKAFLGICDIALKALEDTDRLDWLERKSIIVKSTVLDDEDPKKIGASEMEKSWSVRSKLDADLDLRQSLDLMIS